MDEKKKRQTELTINDYLDALRRSGYLLESEIAKKLSSKGFYVETNQVLLDPKTGKSREIDISAQFAGNFSNDPFASTVFVFEIKKNDFPFVLLTRMSSLPSPLNSDYLKVNESVPFNLIDFNNRDFYYYHIIEQAEFPFAQYCSFSRKKDNDKSEIMAFHPEVIYSGLSKITSYCESFVRKVYVDRYSKILFLPVLLVNEAVYEFEDDTMKEVEYSSLVFNYHHNDLPQSALIYVVTTKGLDEFLKRMLNISERLQEHMAEVFHNNPPEKK